MAKKFFCYCFTELFNIKQFLKSILIFFVQEQLVDGMDGTDDVRQSELIATVLTQNSQV
jgi:hypothetical protein